MRSLGQQISCNMATKKVADAQRLNEKKEAASDGRALGRGATDGLGIGADHFPVRRSLGRVHWLVTAVIG